jgi:hypothetical protein
MTVNRFLLYVVLLLAAAYCGVTFYPRLLFNGVQDYENIRFYTSEPAPERVPVFAGVYEALNSDPFFDPGRTLEVYLAGGYGKYSLLAPFCRKQRSCLHPVSGKVFVASSDLEKDEVYGPGDGGARRTLRGVIIHELVKAQLRNKLGFLRYTFLPDWKSTGYAEHIAKETVDMDTSIICAEGTHEDELAGYLADRLMVELVAAEDSIGYSALLEENYSYEALRSRLMKKYCKAGL